MGESSPGRAMVTSALALFVLVSTTSATDVEPALGQSREPKLFYISSSTTTSTLSTSTICFKSTNALVACSKKRKKRDIVEALPREGLGINPSRNSRMGEQFDEGEVQLGSGEKSMRDPKFLLYWATLTSTSTSTSFTATQTIYSLGCTPTGFGTSVC